MKLIECNACGYRMENPAEAAERDMAAWREKYNNAVADRVAAEHKLAKVLDELATLVGWINKRGFSAADSATELQAIIDREQAIIKEVRDE